MRILSIMTAAAIGLTASYGLASAQATNTAPTPGTTKTLSGTGNDTMDKKGMAQSTKSTAKRSTTGQAPRRERPMAPQPGTSENPVMIR